MELDLCLVTPMFIVWQFVFHTVQYLTDLSPITVRFSKNKFSSVSKRWEDYICRNFICSSFGTRRIATYDTLSVSEYTFYYKQLRSRLSPHSCLYFQGFRDSKLLNGCLVVWPSKPMPARNTMIFRIQNQYLWSMILKFSR